MPQQVITVTDKTGVVVLSGRQIVVTTFKGRPGSDGQDGQDGEDGTDGVGVPAGGTAGQVLQKVDGTDYNTQWVTPVTPQVGIERTVNWVGAVYEFEWSLISSAITERTIQQIVGLLTASGTCNVSVTIDGTPVTGLTNLAASSTPSNHTATAANTVPVGGRVRIAITNVVNAEDLEFTIGME